MDEMLGLYRFFAAILGAILGSFLNVVIYRLPRAKDMVVARSACPLCQAPIPWWCNVPLISWLVLRGKCRSCSGAIHWRYPVVEGLVALIFFLSFPSHWAPQELFRWVFLCAYSSVLVCHFFIDLEHRLLLDSLNIYLLCLVLPFAAVHYSPAHWLAGGLFGFLGPLGVSWAFYKLKGKVGLGGGDIKLWGVLGVLLGPYGIMENIFMSCMLGSLVGIALILAKRYDRENGIPFGPYIIIVAMVQAYFPDVLSRTGINIF